MRDPDAAAWRVPVAAEVADALRAPLVVFVARKVDAQVYEEVGIGAGGGGPGPPDLHRLGPEVGALPQPTWHAVAGQSPQELERCLVQYRGDRPPPGRAERDVILVDDGLADQVVCAEAPAEFYAVGQWCEDYCPTTDDERLDRRTRFRAESARNPNGL
jgi:predicted phosphoribosyltransferase